MTNRVVVTSAFAVVLLLGIGGVPLMHEPSALLAQQSQSSGRGQQMPAMQDMMKMHEQMMAEMKAADTKLDQLVQKMDAAKGEAKVTATADVVRELVAQHKGMADRMGQMHQQMMSGMMTHK